MSLFSKHYTLEEARALLPLIREWFRQFEQIAKELKLIEGKLGRRVAAGQDVGGEMVGQLVRKLADSKDVLREFVQREIQIKDLDRGLIDFPAFRDGKEIFLCWEKDEEDIEFWHDLDTGFPGRERL